MSRPKYHPVRVFNYLKRQYRRERRRLWQRFHLSRSQENIPIFIVGCQRSGTTMLTETLEKSDNVWIYGENERPAFRNYRLAKPAKIKRLTQKSYAPIVVFKPLCDSQWTDQLLEQHPRAKALWLYRDYRDQVNSLVRKFSGAKDVLRKIAQGKLEDIGWRGERINQQLIALAKKFSRDSISIEEAGALRSYMRVQLYYELNLHENDRVLLIKYEDLVKNPVQRYRRIFDFIGCPFDQSYVSEIHASSVSKNEFPEIDPYIQDLWQDLQKRLDQDYSASLHAPTG